MYALGIDIGDSTVHAAISRLDGEPAVVPLDGGPAASSLPLGDDAVDSLMSRVGTPTPLFLGGHPVTAADAVAAIALRSCRTAAAMEDGAPSCVVLTVPPSWKGHRRAALAAALEAAGAPPFSLVSGAVAVAHHRRSSGDIRGRSPVAVLDVGAESVDTAVVGPTPDGALDHLAVPPAPLPWGGRVIDDLVFAHVQRELQERSPGGAQVATQERLGDLRRACTAAKETLSDAHVASVEFGEPGAPATLRVTREELDELIGPAIDECVRTLRGAESAAGLSPEDLDVVLLAGGGARIPVVAERLSAAVGCRVVVGSDPGSAACAGAARLAAHALREIAREEAEEEASAQGRPDQLGRRSHLVHPMRPRRQLSVADRSQRPTGRPHTRPSGRAGIVLALTLALFLVPGIPLTERQDRPAASSGTTSAGNVGPSARAAEQWADEPETGGTQEADPSAGPGTVP